MSGGGVRVSLGQGKGGFWGGVDLVEVRVGVMVAGWVGLTWSSLFMVRVGINM